MCHKPHTYLNPCLCYTLLTMIPIFNLVKGILAKPLGSLSFIIYIFLVSKVGLTHYSMGTVLETMMFLDRNGYIKCL